MKNFICLYLLFFSLSSFAKVAYIPLFDGHDRNNIIENSILAIDLDNGQLLKKTFVGDGVGAVFINSIGNKLYASAENENKIVLIDTTKMEIVNQWDSLSIKPQQIILNKAEDKLYFSEYNNDSIYQIDLTTNHISIALTLNGFERFWYSENLNTIAFKTHDTMLNTYSIYTYSLNNMLFKHMRAVGNNRAIFLDNDGLRFYYPSFSRGRLYSYNLDNLDENWFYFYSLDPSGFLSEHFSNVFMQGSNSLLVTGWHGTYEIDKTTGNGFKISDLQNFSGSYAHVTEKTYLKSSYPQQPICGVPPPGADCVNYLPMQLTIQNHGTNQEQVIFERSRAGTKVRGRYIGETLYSIPIIPLLDLKSLLILFILLLLGLTYKTQFSRV